MSNDNDRDVLINFKKKAAAALFVFVDPAPTLLVAVKYNGTCSVLHSNGPQLRNILSVLTPNGGLYCSWRAFSMEEAAHNYEAQLKSLDLSLFLPKDLMDVKAAW